MDLEIQILVYQFAQKILGVENLMDFSINLPK